MELLFAVGILSIVVFTLAGFLDHQRKTQSISQQRAILNDFLDQAMKKVAYDIKRAKPASLALIPKKMKGRVTLEHTRVNSTAGYTTTYLNSCRGSGTSSEDKDRTSGGILSVFEDEEFVGGNCRGLMRCKNGRVPFFRYIMAGDHGLSDRKPGLAERNFPPKVLKDKREVVGAALCITREGSYITVVIEGFVRDLNSKKPKFKTVSKKQSIFIRNRAGIELITR